MTQAQGSKYTFQLTPKRLSGWAVLMLLLLGWMFVLGVLVGRGTVAVPRKSQSLSNELAELKANELQKERDAIESLAKESSEQRSLDLTYPEELKKAPPKPAVQPRPTPTPAKPKATPAKPATTPAPTAAAKPREVSQVPPLAEPKPVPKPEAAAAPKAVVTPAAAQPAPAKAHFTVQVAAFRDLESANKLVATLRGKGYPAYQVSTETAAKETWFRVRVGAFDSRPAADATLKKLQAEKYQAVIAGTN